MDIDVSHLPIIDFDLGTRLAGNRPELAQDMLNMLIERLEEDVSLIKQVSAENDTSSLVQHIHKLHGAAAYCGTPRLKAVLAKLESDLKNNIMASLPSLLDLLDSEVGLLIQQHKTMLDKA